MQVLKEEIRKRITDAALSAFLQHGYKKASMNQIAKKADITVGNIYSYFPSKEALLHALLDDAVVMLKEIICNTCSDQSSTFEECISAYSQYLAEKCIEFRIPLLILINGCTGSCYEHITTDLMRLACKRIAEYRPNWFSENETNKAVSEAISIGLVKGIIHIFIQCNHDVELLSSVLNQYLSLTLGNLFPKNAPSSSTFSSN